MINVQRLNQNPILKPNPENAWEAGAVFNGCPIKIDGKIYLLYRAMSPAPLSTIGLAESENGVNFEKRQQWIKPEKEWERFGCEDPRVTKLNNKYYIFYTALSSWPPKPEAIRVALAISPDLKKISSKHLVTPFNAKAMALFPEKIGGKIAAVLTANTDLPPAKIGLAFFDSEKQIWNQKYWQKWYQNLNHHILPLQRNGADQIEVGAPPIKTDQGWLLLYCYIKNYRGCNRVFGIEAVLLDLKNPLQIRGKTDQTLLLPEEDWELNGQVPNVIFPSGALIQDKKLTIYYGAADTCCAAAELDLPELLKQMISLKKFNFQKQNLKLPRLIRTPLSPIITPRQGLDWEAKGTFNPAAIYLDSKVHLLYRAFSKNHTSTLGYARLKDGIRVEQRPAEPVYLPRLKEEKKAAPGLWSGCEDPRLTRIGNRIYMTYTAYDGQSATRVALSSIKIDNFLKQRWHWQEPVLISPPGINDKNAAILPEKIDNYYMIFHRINPCIWIDMVKNLDFGKDEWIQGKPWFRPRTDLWDSRKIGISAPPIKTHKGWLLLYHGVSQQDRKYRIGVMLLDLKNPTKVLIRPNDFILEPEADWEKGSIEVVFPCGMVVIKDTLFVYYGGGDMSLGIATISLSRLLIALG